jgi:4-diphosphocytidyl-2-C-methyl-D-erythritol kinase
MRRFSDPEGSFDLAALAPAKLNLGLAVLGRRPDGYHDLRTVFMAWDLADTLRFRVRKEPGITIRVRGGEAPESPENLVVRAGERLAARRAPGRGAEVLLEKRIPSGSGLGGGSSDAAAALLALEVLWGLDPDPAETARLALSVGSDVPFFLLGGTARGEGRGERLTPLPAPPPARWVVAVPRFRISTARAYAALPEVLTGSEAKLMVLEDALREGAFDSFTGSLVNDLEVGVDRMEPRLAQIRGALRDAGAAGVGLTGSGSALFAVFGPQGLAEDLLARGVPIAGVRLFRCTPVTHGARLV